MIDFLATWIRVVSHGGAGARVLTNGKYTGWFFGASDAGTIDPAGLGRVSWVVVRKTRINEVPLPTLRAVAKGFACRLENARFIVLQRGAAARPSAFLDAVRRQIGSDTDAPAGPLFDDADAASSGAEAVATRAIVVTTYNRPAALARTLPQLIALGVPVLVVDDGSNEDASDANRQCAERLGARYLALTENRGVAGAVNLGVAYWLADPKIEWISYFQDDVDVDPELFDVLAVYEDPLRQPVLTGLDTNEHAATRETTDRGHKLKYKANSTGMHLHCHRDYWAAVLPVPSRYLGAPKAGRGGSGADSWIVKRAPGSIVQRGMNALCVCGLVTSFAWRKEDSTWGNQHLVDPPQDPADGSPAE
ncbi:MAG: glycosyltransferase family 2 protein [Alphaproteobacteria bacterium]|nr:glycosyltransferase family 2 protein [Alphaproteobacteria bacterium]